MAAMTHLLKLEFILIATAIFFPAADNKIAKDLVAHPGTNVDVIVQFKTPPTSTHHQKVASHGGSFKADLGRAIKGALYSMPSAAVADLAQDPDVVFIAPDRRVKGTMNYTAAAVNAAMAWSQNNWTAQASAWQ